MHKDLVAFHARMSDPDNWLPCGLCMTLEYFDIDPQTRIEILRLMRKWSKHSGDNSYPLPGGQSAYEEYLFADDRTCASYMWDRETSPYAALRWELLEWMIQETEIELVAPVVPD